MPASWLHKFRIPPKVPTLSRGAIREGIDQPTGDAADNPPMEILIQNSAFATLCACAVPNIPKPNVVPTMSTTCRTRAAFQPRFINVSTSQPPTTRSAIVANDQGTLVYRAE